MSKTYDKSSFEFIQATDKISDEKFNTKSIGYLQDAFIRFRRNKINLVATFILLILMLLSFLVPAVSTKNYEMIDTEAINLPPRIQGLEKLGIFDGSIKRKAATLDPNTGLPLGIAENAIKEGSMKKYEVNCNITSEYCVGGTVGFQVDAVYSNFTVLSKNINFVSANNPSVLVNVASFSSTNTTLNVYVRTNDNIDHLLGTLTNTTATDLAIPSSAFGGNDTVSAKLVLEVNGQVGAQNRVVLNSVDFKEGNTVVLTHKEHTLSGYESASSANAGAGLKLVLGAKMQVVYYKYLPYVAQYSNREVLLSQEQYDEYEAKGAIVKIVEENIGCVTLPGGIKECSYRVIQDTLKVKGLSSEPYFWFGTNSEGHDMFTKLFSGVKISLLIGFLAAAINIVIGIIYGSFAGYYGGKTDLVLSRITEVLGGIPFVAILTVATLYFGNGLFTVIIAVCLTGWIGVAAVTRTQFYRYKGREYVLASRTLGASDKRLIFRHILPNGIGTLVTTSVLMIPGMIGLESMLSYLKLGLLNTPSIGVIMAAGQEAGLRDFPWLTLFPAIIISLLMITFNMFGLALRDALNPSLRGS